MWLNLLPHRISCHHQALKMGTHKMSLGLGYYILHQPYVEWRILVSFIKVLIQFREVTKPWSEWNGPESKLLRLCNSGHHTKRAETSESGGFTPKHPRAKHCPSRRLSPLYMGLTIIYNQKIIAYCLSNQNQKNLTSCKNNLIFLI